MVTKKYKTNDYEPNDWSKNPSEKRLVAIKTTHTPNMTTEEQSKTTEIMSSKKIEAIKETFKEEIDTLFKPECNFKNNQENSYKKYFNNELVETEIMDCSHETCLHSAQRHESDMIAVEPKNSGTFHHVRVGARIRFIIFLRWFRKLFRVFFILLLI